MIFIAILLIVLGIIKTVFVYFLDSLDLSKAQSETDVDIESFRNSVVLFLLIDSIVGILGGIYILLL